MKLFEVLLFVHIAAGFVSLASGLVVIVTKKASAFHRKMGTIFYFAMLINSVIAIPMSYLRPNYFLFLLSVFTIYLLLTGKRYLRMVPFAPVGLYDKSLTTLMSVFGFAFLGLGIFNVYRSNFFGIVFIVFGIIALLLSFQDVLNYLGKSKIRNYNVTTHLQRMIGSYIASVTAFLVVNNQILPGIVAWLLPTILLTPLIVAWTRKFKLQL